MPGLACCKQDIGTPQTAAGQHQALSSFWQPHLQRAARAELALSVHSAAKRAEREHQAAWHLQKVCARIPSYPARGLLSVCSRCPICSQYSACATMVKRGLGASLCGHVQGHERTQRSAQNPVVIGGSALFWGDLYGSTKVRIMQVVTMLHCHEHLLAPECNATRRGSYGARLHTSAEPWAVLAMHDMQKATVGAEPDQAASKQAPPQDLGPEQCEVPCRWAVGEAAMRSADMLLGMAMYSAAEIQSLQRRRPEQTIALFSMVRSPTRCTFPSSEKQLRQRRGSLNI